MCVGFARPGSGKNKVIALLLLGWPGVHTVCLPLQVLQQEMRDVLLGVDPSASVYIWSADDAADITSKLRAMNSKSTAPMILLLQPENYTSRLLAAVFAEWSDVR